MKISEGKSSLILAVFYLNFPLSHFPIVPLLRHTFVNNQMPNTRNLKLTDRKQKIFEEAITKTVLSNLDKIIEEKCKVILERSAAAKSSKKRTNSEPTKNDEIEKLRKEVEKLRNDLLIVQSGLTSRR